ncbi:hypothetical protein L9F63_001255 [Diploptera punctata]|uniref:Uncharacterized protein n=1 Tax=Diploptera punctata TaxID=6984 RepID=A0AAD8A4D8_DIPPU|nr:hypothetical protein L9F63_001255 [Diploptera punctata]
MILKKILNSKCNSHEEEIRLCKEQIDFLNTRLKDANEAEKNHMSEITACQSQLKEYKDQLETLDRRFNEELMRQQENFNSQLNSKCEEIEALHKCLKEARNLKRNIEMRHYFINQKQVDNLKENFELEISKLSESHSLELKEKDEKNLAGIELFNKQMENLVMELSEMKKSEQNYKNEVIIYQSKIEEVIKERDDYERRLGDEIAALKKFAGSQDELEAYKEQVKTLKESFEVEISKLSEHHKNEIRGNDEKYSTEIELLNKQIENLVKELSNVKNSEEKEKNDKIDEEIIVYKEKLQHLESHLQKCNGFEEKEKNYEAEIAVYKQQLQELKLQLQKYNRNEEKYVEDLTKYQTEITANKNVIESLYAKLKEEKEFHKKK